MWLAAVLSLCVSRGPAQTARSLWLGTHAGQGGTVYHTDPTGNVLQSIPNLPPVTGIAFDGQFLYFEDDSGVVTQRSADGGTIQNTFIVPISSTTPCVYPCYNPHPTTVASEDLAWDTSRQRLWRISQDNKLTRIDPVLRRSDKSFQVDATLSGMESPEGVGLAYDGTRDLLYVSFFEQESQRGVVLEVSPDNGAVIGALFHTSFQTLGLGYDAGTDSLWAGGDTLIRNLSLTGQVLASFPRTLPGGLVDGLEFIGPGVLQGCRINPRNRFMPFHREEFHERDPQQYPLHVLTAIVYSDGVPASGVAVSIAASRPVFTSAAAQPPTLTSLTANTDITGQVAFSFNPPNPAAFDRTTFTATGTVDGKPFSCQASVLVGVGALSAAVDRYLNSESLHAAFQPFAEDVLAFRRALLDSPSLNARQKMPRSYRRTIRKVLDMQLANLNEADLRVMLSLARRLGRSADPAVRESLARLKKDLEDPRAGQRLAKMFAQASSRKLAARANVPASAPAPASSARIQTDFGQLPLDFEPNNGQAAGDVRYLARGPGYNLYLSPREVTLVDHTAARLSGAKGSVLRMQLAGTDARPGDALPGMVALEELPGKSHYIRGKDRAQWHTNVPHYGQIRYEGIYPGVDLVFYGRGHQFEFDFIVAPGASPNDIAITFPGVERLAVEPSGNLALYHATGKLALERPLVYQMVDGVRQKARGEYILRSENRVGFAVTDYDATRPLVIDPVLSYASYLGGGGDEYGSGVAVDSQGNAYVTGATTSIDFPTVPKVSAPVSKNLDVFVTKLNATGSGVIYSTYLGGSDDDVGLAIAVDPSGNAYVTGTTSSSNFPLVQPLQKVFGGGNPPIPGDAFVFKLNAAGSALVYSTYLGGSGEDAGRGIAVDAAGHAYVTGVTSSKDFLTKNAFQAVPGGSRDAFVVKLNPQGSDFMYATYLGGAYADFGLGIAADASGNAYVTGATYSSNFPTHNALQPSNHGSADAFVAKLDATGTSLLFSTYLGGESDDYGMGIAVDSTNNVYVTGPTGSPDFPLMGAAQSKFGSSDSLGTDVFVTKVAANGAALAYSTFLGGSGVDVGLAIAVGPDGSAYVAGETDSSDFKLANAIQTASAGLDESFVAKLNPAGSAFVYSTSLGGSGQDVANSIAVDSSGGVYVAGSSTSVDFPATFGGYQTSTRGLTDALVMKIVEGTPPPGIATISAASFAVGGAVAAESIVSGFGQGLATGTEQALTLPLPQTLAGASVKVKDSGGTERSAPLFYASQGQINYEIPAGTANGLASVSVLVGGQVAAAGTVRVASVAPGLFSANANGQGVAAALALKAAADHSQTSQLIFQCGSAPGSCVAIPIDLGAPTDQVILLLFGTGIRGRSSLSAVSASVGGHSVPVQFAGAQGAEVGEDQINVGPLPRGLQGSGEVNITLTVDGATTNTVTVKIK